ncbi:hypothetical protein [Soonwooa sp.]|uniref:hypothetical protein n=1 Tax=Soonwooa sp. TaxID=1938592 RepID=UPI00262E6AEA|nr:hypothetical protein [Soonwooa sp.]
MIFILLFLYSCKQDKTADQDKLTSNDYYELAWKYLEQQDNLAAYKNFILAKNEFQRKKDSLGVGKSLMNAAIIQINSADYLGSEENNILALKFFGKAQNNIYLVSVYNSLALSRNNLGDFTSALYWYEKALSASTNDDESFLIKNNTAIAFSKLKKYDEGIALLKSIRIDKPEDAFNIKSKVIDNLAYIQFLKNSNYNAETEFYKALEIRTKGNDLVGQNASHSHLADFFVKTNKEKALFHAKEMLRIASELTIQWIKQKR